MKRKTKEKIIDCLLYTVCVVGIALLIKYSATQCVLECYGTF